MLDYQKKFVDLSIEKKALTFGKFTLKSGRKSPYFFNAGVFSSGKAISILAESFAAAIVSSGLEFDTLFGPAYKGIPLAAVVAETLFRKYGMDVNYVFNRKEKKDHGEGGNLVGKLTGRVLIIDDVITAGTAIREAIQLVKSEGGVLVGVVIAFDRQEKGLQSDLSSVAELSHEFDMKMLSIISFQDLLAYLEKSDDQSCLQSMKEYQIKYCAFPSHVSNGKESNKVKEGKK